MKGFFIESVQYLDVRVCRILALCLNEVCGFNAVKQVFTRIWAIIFKTNVCLCFVALGVLWLLLDSPWRRFVFLSNWLFFPLLSSNILFHVCLTTTSFFLSLHFECLHLFCYYSACVLITVTFLPSFLTFSSTAETYGSAKFKCLMHLSKYLCLVSYWILFLIECFLLENCIILKSISSFVVHYWRSNGQPNPKYLSSVPSLFGRVCSKIAYKKETGRGTGLQSRSVLLTNK